MLQHNQSAIYSGKNFYANKDDKSGKNLSSLPYGKEIKVNLAIVDSKTVEK